MCLSTVQKRWNVSSEVKRVRDIISSVLGVMSPELLSCAPVQQVSLESPVIHLLLVSEGSLSFAYELPFPMLSYLHAKPVFERRNVSVFPLESIRPSSAV